MKIDDKIRDEKLQYDINKEAAKISTLPSVKIDIYEYFKGEEILPLDESGMTKQAKFTFFPLGKAFEKTIKAIESQRQNKEATEEHGKQLPESNKLVKRYDYDTDKDNLAFLKQKDIFNKLIDKRHHEY